ncbi:hypothetical protein WNY37_07435 [Henriciella sp. AS95]|uniref:hypothetical protein n=1 Tax=Henriciella sp. AS95 TaxID=3135782 RepID=UPI00316FF021
MKQGAAVFLFLAALAVASCGGEEPVETVRLKVEAAPDYMRPSEADESVESDLSEDAQATVDELRRIIESNSLNQLARFADSEPAFISNFAGASHRTHWDLLRRTGFDPILTLEKLLDGPHGVKMVSGEAWFIWPELAALDPEELQHERLSFSQRARLEELVGESGIAEVRNGDGYPGVRTAIAEDGRWLYFVHETAGEE